MSRHPPPNARPYNSLPRSLSDSLRLGAGARLSRCLSPTLPSGRLLPEPRGLCAGRSPGGCRAQAGARAEASSPEPVSPEPEPRRARARRAAAASLGSRDSGNGVSRPGGRSRGRVGSPPARVFTCRTSALRPRSPAAAGLLCQDADVWRVLGERVHRVAFPLGGRGAGAVRSLERMRSGGGEILQGPRRRGSFGSADTAPPCLPALTPVALGLGVGEGRPCGSAPTSREREEGAARGGNFVSTRVSRDQKTGTGAAVTEQVQVG